jgi:hypothetical protein
MPKATLIVSWTDSEGKPHAAGEEVDLSDEDYQALRADGKVANVDQPYAGQEGNYGARTVRPGESSEPAPEETPDTAGTAVNTDDAPEPAAADDEPDEPVKPAKSSSSSGKTAA